LYPTQEFSKERSPFPLWFISEFAKTYSRKVIVIYSCIINAIGFHFDNEKPLSVDAVTTGEEPSLIGGLINRFGLFFPIHNTLTMTSRIRLFIAFGSLASLKQFLNRHVQVTLLEAKRVSPLQKVPY